MLCVFRSLEILADKTLRCLEGSWGPFLLSAWWWWSLRLLRSGQSSCLGRGMKGGLTRWGHPSASTQNSSGFGRDSEVGREGIFMFWTHNVRAWWPFSLKSVNPVMQYFHISHWEKKYAGLDLPVIFFSWKGLSFTYGILQLQAAHLDLLVLTSIHGWSVGTSVCISPFIVSV